MSRYMFLLLIFQLWSTALLHAEEVTGDVCQVAAPSCPANQFCIPTAAKQGMYEFGSFSSDGVCAPLKQEGQECKVHGLQSSCSSGLTCLPIPANSMQGLCIKITEPNALLNIPEAVATYMNTYGQVADIPDFLPLVKAFLRLRNEANLSNLSCKYFPGNYVFGDSDQTQCCGVPKPVPSPDGSSTPLSSVYYCDYINLSDSKSTYSPSFCGFGSDDDGIDFRLRWVGPQATQANPMPSGRCALQTAYPPDIIDAIPTPVPNPNTCIAEFSPEVEEDRIGLMSTWEATNFVDETVSNRDSHTDDFIHWFRSHPNKNHYVPGDELFILSWLWLFKNTDRDSRKGLNFYNRDEIAIPLYNIFDKFYAQSYRQAFDLISFLENNKECIEITSAFSLQSRYTINKLLYEGLLGSIRGYQCGSSAVESSTASCSQQSDEFFREKFRNSFRKANAEYNDCARVTIEGTNCTKSGNHDLFYQNWQDPERHNFIVNSIKETYNGWDTGAWPNGPFNNLGIDGLADPPINSEWVPEEFKNKDIAGLWTKARINANNPNVKIPGSAELYPIYHWSLLVDPAKFGSAFPDKLRGKPSFLHYHSNMEFISNESAALFTANYPSMIDPVSQRWNGPQMIATNAAHLMELYSSTDSEFDKAHLHFKRRFQSYLVRHHLTRLFQYYYTKVLAIESEQACLYNKIKEISRGLGHNVDAPDWDPVAIRLDKTPKCSALAGGLSFGSNSTISESGEGPLTVGVVPLNTPENKNANLQTTGATTGMSIGGLGAGLGTGNLGSATLSLSTAKGPIGLAGGDAGTFAKAVKEGFDKRKERLLLEHKKYAEDTGNNPIVQNMREMESQKNKNTPMAPLSRYKGSSNPTLAALGGLSEVGKVAPESESAISVSATKQGTLADDSVAGSAPINLGGNKMAASNLPGHTGLSPADQQQILKAISPNTYQKDDKDSLWQILNKAYVRSYKKLFDSQ